MLAITKKVTIVMKGCCPNCKMEFESIPTNGKCVKCDKFSKDWIIYDWVGYSRFKRVMIKCNWVLLILCVFNLLATALGSGHIIQWLFGLLIIPTLVSLVSSYKALANAKHYKGHTLKDVTSWFPLL